MKKLIALFLVLMLLFSLTMICFADEGLEDGDSPTGEAHEDPHDNSPTSPETGADCLLAGLALCLGFVGLTVSGKKLFH